MSYDVVLTRSFKHSVERLIKRFRHVKDDIHLAVETLLQIQGWASLSLAARASANCECPILT